ncbi:MAG TPA: transglycosylase domain-containing protein [Acidimicrobiales bacterium]|nr:transglycosylase domain-containing protein [Acidimicrobiales bacterium]
MAVVAAGAALRWATGLSARSLAPAALAAGRLLGGAAGTVGPALAAALAGAHRWAGRARARSRAWAGELAEAVPGARSDLADRLDRARAELVVAGRWAARTVRAGGRASGPALRAGGRAMGSGGRAVGRGARALAPVLAPGLRWWRRVAGRAVPAAARVALRAAGLAVPVVLVVAVLAWLVPGPALRLAGRSVAEEVDGPGHGLGPLARRSVIAGPDGAVLTVLHAGENRRVVSLAEVPPIVRRLVLVAEDARFFGHEGYDMRGIARAAVANVRASGVAQGGSTISQQLAKQNFVGSEPTLDRKVRELVYAVALEDRMPKRALLERYLNQVYFGSGAYGLAAAAEEYFGVEPGALTVDQAALLAGLIRSPSRLDPRSRPERALARRNAVLGQAARAGLVPRAEVEALRRLPLGVIAPVPAPLHEPAVVEAVKREFLASPAFGAGPQARRRLLLEGGVWIETTVQPHLQQLARAVVAGAAGAPTGPGAALAAVDPATGEVRALATETGGQPFDVASLGRRQPGSAMKPLAAVAALEAGLSPDQPLQGDGPVEFAVEPEPWAVDNFGGRDHGAVDLRQALVSSVNTAFAQLAVSLGPDAIAAVLARLGVDVEAALGPPAERGPAIAIGGTSRGVSPLEMASAYGVFATAGAHAPPTFIARVVGPDGHEIYRRPDQARPALPPAVATTVRAVLEEAVQTGTGTAARLGSQPVAGKTGTTQDSADAWFVGTAPMLSTALWVGHAESRVPMPGATGGQVAAPLWHRFMAAAVAGQPPASFPGPSPGPLPAAPGGAGGLPLVTPQACSPSRCPAPAPAGG